MNLVKSLFKPSRVMLAMFLAPLGDPVFAQEPGPAGYNPAKHPREIHFSHWDSHSRNLNGPHVPYLVELDRDTVELRCAEGKPFALAATPDYPDQVFYCPGPWAVLGTGKSVLRFDRAPSELPHMVLGVGGMGVTLACDIGVLRPLYEPVETSQKFRCAAS